MAWKDNDEKQKRGLHKWQKMYLWKSADYSLQKIRIMVRWRLSQPETNYKKNGKHYILYDEVQEGFDGVTKSVIKVNDDFLDVTKKGVTNVHNDVWEKQEK